MRAYFRSNHNAGGNNFLIIMKKMLFLLTKSVGNKKLNQKTNKIRKKPDLINLMQDKSI